MALFENGQNQIPVTVTIIVKMKSKPIPYPTVTTTASITCSPFSESIQDTNFSFIFFNTSHASFLCFNHRQLKITAISISTIPAHGTHKGRSRLLRFFIQSNFPSYLNSSRNSKNYSNNEPDKGTTKCIK